MLLSNRLYGIGFAAVAEPSVSNMGYITTVLSPLERQKAGPKGGAQAAATVALDPLGGVSVAIDSVPQGQGHRTVTAQIVADVFGLTPAVIRVDAGLDTSKDAWSIAAGNYSSRFAGATGYSVPKMVRLALSGLTSFSTVPLHLAAVMTLSGIVIGCGVALYAVIGALLGRVVPGFGHDAH